MPARLEMLLDMPTVNRCCIFFIRQHRVDHLLQGDSSEARLEFWRQIVEHFCQGQLQHLQHGHDWSASLFSSKASPSRFRRTTSWLSTDTLWHRAPTVSEQRFPETNLLHKYKFIRSSDKLFRYGDFFWKNYCGAPGGPRSAILATMDHDPLYG